MSTVCFYRLGGHSLCLNLSMSLGSLHLAAVLVLVTDSQAARPQPSNPTVFFQIHGSEEVILTTLIVTRCRDLQKHTTYLLLVGYRRRQRKACNTLSIRSRVVEKVASCVVLCHCWLVNGRASSPVKSLCRGSLPARMEEKKNKENRLIQHHVYKK